MGDSIERISLTIPTHLVEDLDDAVETWEYSSRSEAFRDALRMFLSSLEFQSDLETAHCGSITTIYRHGDHSINDEMLELQHEMSDLIIATQHVHLDSHLCLETMVVNGSGEQIKQLVNSLRALDGMEQVQFTNV